MIFRMCTAIGLHKLTSFMLVGVQGGSWVPGKRDGGCSSEGRDPSANDAHQFSLVRLIY